MLTPEIKHAINLALKVEIPFVAYVAPGSTVATFFSDISIGSTLAGRRFIVNAWSAGTADEFTIFDRADAKQTIDYISSNNLHAYIAPRVWPETTTRSEYESSLDAVIEFLQNHGGKVVLSRTLVGDSSGVNWSEVADLYFDLHSEAFRYIYFTPRHGCWLGASPELLLTISNGKFKTMALAGTRRLDQADQSWSGKNIAEQAIVRNYIVDGLYDLGLNPHCSQTETMTTGNLQHLCTVIYGDIESCTPKEILSTLNPTPALAGYPLASALEQIAEAERHPRRCYGGYVAIDSTDEFVAYVNLRCVNFDRERWCMYVGSGVMPDSDIEDEWLETEAKAQLLKSIIEDSHK